MVESSRPSPAQPPTDRVAWSARFGWIAGGVAGLMLGFLATYALEVLVLRAHSADPTAAASRAAGVVVPAFFVAGALGGHSFGAGSAGARYKFLGVAAGVALTALGWSLLALTR